MFFSVLRCPSSRLRTSLRRPSTEDSSPLIESRMEDTVQVRSAWDAHGPGEPRGAVAARCSKTGETTGATPFIWGEEDATLSTQGEEEGAIPGSDEVIASFFPGGFPRSSKRSPRPKRLSLLSFPVLLLIASSRSVPARGSSEEPALKPLGIRSLIRFKGYPSIPTAMCFRFAYGVESPEGTASNGTSQFKSSELNISVREAFRGRADEHRGYAVLGYDLHVDPILGAEFGTGR